MNVLNINFSLLPLKFLVPPQPSYLHNLISRQPSRSTRSSSAVILSRPPTVCSLKMTHRSFIFASLRLWNQLSASPVLSRLTSSFTCQAIFVVITTLSIPRFSLFHFISKHTFSSNPSNLVRLLITLLFLLNYPASQEPSPHDRRLFAIN